MRISLVISLALIFACTCEARSRTYSFGLNNVSFSNIIRDDHYYQTSVQQVQVEIQQREYELQQDKYNLKENRPTGKFSYAGHQEQIENKKRHLINLSEEYTECIQLGYCKGYIAQESLPTFSFANFNSQFSTQAEIDFRSFLASC